MNSHNAPKTLRRLPRLIPVMAIIVASLSIYAASAINNKAAAGSAHFLPSLMANYQLTHQPSQEVIARFQITIAQDNLRIDQQGEGGAGSIILNNRLDKMWLLDRKLKLFHEVPLLVNNSETASEKLISKKNSSEEINLESEYFAAFIQLKPCSGMNPERVLDAENTVTNTQIWECRVGGKIVEKQWFDIKFGLVVKSESFDGLVATITNINDIAHAVEYFEPPSNYRLATLDEIISISQPLSYYEARNEFSVKPVTSRKFMTESTKVKNTRFTDK